MSGSDYARTAEGHWEWPCRVLEVIDGDTIVVLIDRGFEDRSVRKVRLYGVDTAEVHNTAEDSPEYQRGKNQEFFVSRWLEIDSDEDFPFALITYEREGNFGRWLGDIELKGNSLSEAILDEWPHATY